MNIKYLYVLTSTPKDIYYEQFLLSAKSLKMKMPDAEVILLCDTKTKETLTGKRREYEKLVSKTITVEAPDKMNQIEISRWVRTSMRRFVEGDFLFLDGDTIVTDNLSSIAGLNIKFGACLDKHSFVDRHSKRKNIIEKNKHLGFNSHISNRHYNGGVLFCADIPEIHKIFDRWHELWLFSNSRNIVRDQPSLNMTIHENLPLFTELDGTWNCQIAFNGLPYLSNSKIIHYFASDLNMHSSPFLLASGDIFKKIKETGFIPDETLESLKNPKEAFVRESRIIAGDDALFVINSNLFEFILLIRQKLPFLFNVFNGFCSFCKKIAKFFLIKKDRKKDGGIRYYN